jgi:hypothetical protein
MSGNASQPGYSRVSRWRAGIEPSGDGATDECGAFFFEQFDQALLLGNQSVDCTRRIIEELRDAKLILEGFR